MEWEEGGVFRIRVEQEQMDRDSLDWRLWCDDAVQGSSYEFKKWCSSDWIVSLFSR